jgi:hypothetical protein
MRLIALLGVVAVSVMGVGANAYAEPADVSGNKIVDGISEEGTIYCDDTEVSYLWEEWSQTRTSEQQDLLLVHVTRTYTIGDQSLPFFRFVGSFADRSYEGLTGDRTSSRAGLDEGFIGHTLVNEFTEEVTRNGQETLSPDEQACAVLAG